MRFYFYSALILLAAVAAWRIGFDSGGLPPRLIFDTPVQETSTRRPHPAGGVPFGEERPATGSGAELFSIHCAHCHGLNGSGQSYTAAYPGMPAVGNLQTNERHATERRLIFEDGRGAMPAFRHRLRAADRDAIHHYIQSLPPCENVSSL